MGMLPDNLKQSLNSAILEAEQPREKAVDVMFELQGHYGYMSDQAMTEAAELLGMTTLELEELATFYNFIFREPVGKYVIHVCDSAICWIDGCQTIIDYLCSRLNVQMGGTTADGLFTLLPVCCIGYCDRSPAMLINRIVYGNLNAEKIDRILQKLTEEAQASPSE
jgi:NADH-quinone oxidoreductase subunit E